MKVVEWRPSAETDVAEAAFWFAQQGGVALGQRFLLHVESTLQRIALFPESGSTRHADLVPHLPMLLRFMVVPTFERYLVYYLDLPQRVDVVRVWCVDRGLDALLQDLS